MSTYLDNAATSFPKPPAVLAAISEYMMHNGSNPGRGSYTKAKQATALVDETRELLCELLGFNAPDNVIFTANVTEAINIAIRGIVKKGDHVIISSLEHNAVWRCLQLMRKELNISITAVPCSKEGFTDPGQVEAAIRPETSLVVFTHASNVIGTVQPIREIGCITGRMGIPLLVDCAQTAGSYPIHFAKDNIDILAFTGHKGLLGPMGIGGLLISPGIEIRPLIVGGTGRDSMSPVHPSYYPDRLEAGTMNMLGIVGLRSAIKFILEQGVHQIVQKESDIAGYALKRLSALPGVAIHGPKDPQKMVGIISLNFDSVSPAEIAYVLDEIYDIAVRAGLHCSPCAHQVLATQDTGTLRISTGYFNSRGDMDLLANALEEILHK
ncbi:MAG TPA: aminotransferase class V-fold PLP-dependent enzyme [Methylomusa anaerophila]|uniref:cysteine desulfurase n=1 Tax=Methylomusa anaerophila TaxID=1930071 RepID=A0A348AG58_9FIRM|nr:aminotransferase class V-fold PLP-dependent enzyme [Methylomusa anaerophila]BBB90056.1 putative cysteine desulfurase [Methylomusa anaerophila]HML88217.1 aminotransferase class V-fold PLP-dependent enzyme [Methylomusa anaerophila]